MYVKHLAQFLAHTVRPQETLLIIINITINNAEGRPLSMFQTSFSWQTLRILLLCGFRPGQEVNGLVLSFPALLTCFPHVDNGFL